MWSVNASSMKNVLFRNDSSQIYEKNVWNRIKDTKLSETFWSFLADLKCIIKMFLKNQKDKQTK